MKHLRWVALLGLTSAVAWPSAGQATSPAALVYGSALQADALANTQIGGRSPRGRVSYRFRSPQAGELAAVRLYLKWDSRRPGYHGGNGGSLRLSVQEDDNTPDHRPSGRVLAETRVERPMGRAGYFQPLAFAAPPPLQRGRLYHLVVENSDARPETNFLSINSLLTRQRHSPRQPGRDDVGWALLHDTGRGWRVREQHTPILQIEFADGTAAGVGYMEVWVKQPKVISGRQAVRQTLHVGAERTVTGVSVRVRRMRGDSLLLARLEREDGTLLEAISLSPVSGSSHAWASGRFSRPLTLQRAQAYQLVLRSPDQAAYETFPVRDGSVGCGFAPTTAFAEGRAEYTVGVGWFGWEQWGRPDRPDADLQFYFHVR